METTLPDYSNHPAVVLGKMIKEKRRALGFTLGKFASFIGVDVCQYCEVEMGLGDWIGYTVPLQILKTNLFLTPDENETFDRLYYDYCESDVLEMKDLFTRDQMRPAFPPTRDWTREKEEQLLDAVFKPLE